MNRNLCGAITAASIFFIVETKLGGAADRKRGQAGTVRSPGEWRGERSAKYFLYLSDYQHSSQRPTVVTWPNSTRDADVACSRCFKSFSHRGRDRQGQQRTTFRLLP